MRGIGQRVLGFKRLSPFVFGSGAIFIGFVLSCASLMITSRAAAQSCISPPASLSAWWTGNGTPNDFWGAHSGTMRNGATYGTGKAGQGFQLDGTNDWVDTPDAPDLNPGTGPFTVDLWVKFDLLSGEQVLVEKRIEGGDPSGWEIEAVNDRLWLRAFNGSVGYSPDHSLSTNTWIHVAFRRNANVLTLFLNGNAVLSAGLPFSPGEWCSGSIWCDGSLNSPSSVKFGHRGVRSDTPGADNPDSNSFFLHGQVDEVHFFNAALSDSEIQAIYAADTAGLCVPTPGCGNHWLDAGEECDDGNGTNGDGCDTDCRFSCGDSNLDAGEGCDDGNHTDGDGCDHNCTPTGCGNGIVTAGEACDAGAAIDYACTSTCKDRNTGWDARFGNPSGGGLGIPSGGVGPITATASAVYVGGTFTSVGGVSANRIAKWDGSSWSALGPGMDNGSVNAIAVIGTDVYAAGGFTTIGGMTVNGIAKWNGSSWSPLGSGLCAGASCGATESALAVIGTDLYVGGNFTTAGGTLVNHVAKWDGSQWSALGSGTEHPEVGSGGDEGAVATLAVIGNVLYAAGDFTKAGGTRAIHVAKWDGTEWSALGSGISSTAGVSWAGVSSLAASGTNLYAGGTFDLAGGKHVSSLARWDGSNWWSVGSGVEGDVSTILAVGNDLYVGGALSRIGTIQKINLAVWNGTSWSTLGSSIEYMQGVDSRPTALAAFGTDLYVGGTFTEAGRKDSLRFGIWHAVCGNDVRDIGEECEDGNLDETDSCKNNCMLNICGDGALQAGVELCEDGNTADGDGCDSNCTPTGCGNGIQTAGEACDDSNTVNGDGCDNDCTVSVCGNGITAGGETCDDGNLVNGDGCESDCTLTPIVQVVAAGGTVTTDPAAAGPSPEFPVQLALTTPVGGTVSIKSADSSSSTTGFQVIGAQLDITAPAATVDNPLVLVIAIDASSIPAGLPLSQLAVTRNGKLVGPCVGTAGVADPDPCMQPAEVLPSGAVQLTVLTSHASLWTAGVRGLSPAEQKCVKSMNLSGVKVAKAQGKLNRDCLKLQAKGTSTDAQGCMTADVAGKVASAVAKVAAGATNLCASPPLFGFTSASAIGNVARNEELSLAQALFGSALDNAVVAITTSKVGAACQAGALASTQTFLETETTEFLACKKAVLLGKTLPLATSAEGLENCFAVLAADSKGKIAKAVAKLAKSFAKSCSTIDDLSAAFPGSCSTAADFTDCLRAQASCRVCRMFNTMDGLAQDCDVFDDGLANASCP